MNIKDIGWEVVGWIDLS